MRSIKICSLLLVFSLMISCKKETSKPCAPELNKGVLILNEGLFQQNNSTLTFYSNESQTSTQEYFNAKNDRGLGDTGNDMIRYGNKIYIVVNVSGQVEVIDFKTGTLIQQINFQDNGISKQPRSTVAKNGSVWVSSFDGTVSEIDTVSLSIVSSITVGRNPEGLDIDSDKLYVVNSGGLDAPNYDSTISVIDLNSKTVIDTFNVVINPSSVEVNNDVLYCISRGNYGAIDAQLQRMNSQTGELLETYSFEPLGMQQFNDKLYVLYRESSGETPKIGIINFATGVLENSNFISNSNIETYFGFDIDSQGKFHLKDAQGYVNTGIVYVYDSDGNYLHDIQTGLNPNSVVLIE